MRVVLRKSVATGGASAVRPAAFADVVIPAGWLHDRWWSLVAAAREELLVDDTIVLDYRVSSAQEVGLDTGHQGQAVLGRMMGAAGGLRTTMNKLEDIRHLLPAVRHGRHAALAHRAAPAAQPDVTRVVN